MADRSEKQRRRKRRRDKRHGAEVGCAPDSWVKEWLIVGLIVLGLIVVSYVLERTTGTPLPTRFGS